MGLQGQPAASPVVVDDNGAGAGAVAGADAGAVSPPFFPSQAHPIETDDKQAATAAIDAGAGADASGEGDAASGVSSCFDSSATYS